MKRITPEIHELAFSYRDYGKEVDCIEYNWQKAAKTENQNVLDICCGTGSHIEQFIARGYECCGIDLDPEMINFANNRLSKSSPPVEIFEVDMRDFSLERRFGLAINMLTSANLIHKNEDMITHLRSVANTLEPGGIYFLEMSHPREYGSNAQIPTRSWEVTKDDMLVRADITLESDFIEPMVQTQQTTLKVTIVQDETEEVYEEPEPQRIYLFLEFLSLVQNAGGFELITCLGTFNSSVILDSSPRSWRMIPVLRRTNEVIP